MKRIFALISDFYLVPFSFESVRNSELYLAIAFRKSASVNKSLKITKALFALWKRKLKWSFKFFFVRNWNQKVLSILPKSNTALFTENRPFSSKNDIFLCLFSQKFVAGEKKTLVPLREAPHTTTETAHRRTFFIKTADEHFHITSFVWRATGHTTDCHRR